MLELEAACQFEFMENLKGAGAGEITEAQRNRVAGEAVFKTLRAHYKGYLKMSNKTYDPDSIPEGPEGDKRRRRIDDAKQANISIGEHRGRSAHLAEFVANGIGNCGEMSEVAIHMIRSLGLPVARAQFDARVRDDAHTFCVVGHETIDWAVAGLQVERPEDLFVVDIWSGIACPMLEFHEAFRAKMEEWDTNGKMVIHWINSAEGPAIAVMSSPLAEEWLDDTVRRDIIFL